MCGPSMSMVSMEHTDKGTNAQLTVCRQVSQQFIRKGVFARLGFLLVPCGFTGSPVAIMQMFLNKVQ